MRKLCLMLLALSLTPMAAQDEYWKNTGSAKAMLGKTYILSIYGATPSNFSDKEIKRHQNAMYQATDWLTAQAKRYQQNISFKLGEFHQVAFSPDLLVDGDKIDNIAEDHPLYEISPVEMALTAIDHTPQSFLDFVKNDCPECRSVVVMVFANKKGRSYAHSFEQGDPENKFLEGVMMFNSQDDATLSSELSHEILHCFGAYDFYATDESKLEKQRDKLMRKTFPKDIMLELEYESELSNKKRIDNFTAYAIGWLPTYNGAWKKKIIPAR